MDVFTRSQDEHVPHVLHDLGFGNRIVHIPAGPEIPISKQELPAFIPDFVSGVQNFAEQKEIHYDLIHSHYWMSGIASISLKKEWDIPTLHMFHTLSLLKTQNSNSSPDENAFRTIGEQKVMDEIDRIIAATEDESSKMVRLLSNQSDRK